MWDGLSPSWCVVPPICKLYYAFVLMKLIYFFRVSSSFSFISQAFDEEFSPSANYQKGHEELFNWWIQAYIKVNLSCILNVHWVHDKVLFFWHLLQYSGRFHMALWMPLIRMLARPTIWTSGIEVQCQWDMLCIFGIYNEGACIISSNNSLWRFHDVHVSRIYKWISSFQGFPLLHILGEANGKLIRNSFVKIVSRTIFSFTNNIIMNDLALLLPMQY